MIKRSVKDRNFTIICNDCLHDSSISAKAKGIYAYVMSMPDDWSVYQNELKTHFTDGRDGIASGINELVVAGYVFKEKSRSSGKFDGWDYTFFDHKQNQAPPKPDYPTSGNPNSGNPQLVSTKPDQVLNDNNISGVTGVPSHSNLKDSNAQDKPEAEKEIKNKETSPPPEDLASSNKFIPPTMNEVYQHMASRLKERGVKVSSTVIQREADNFCLFYDEKDWMRDRKKMKKWKLAASRWCNNAKAFEKTQQRRLL